MAEQCFNNEDSNSPFCAVHDVRLITKQLPAEMIAAGFKVLTLLVCTVSGALLHHEKRRI